MEAAALITKYLQNQSGIDTTDSVARENARRNLQDVFVLVANDRNWEFRYGTAEITFAAARPTTALLPVDYLSWGPAGGLFIKNGVGKPIKWTAQANYLRALEQQDERQTQPRAYTELGTDATGRKAVALYPSLTASLTCVCHYYRVPPTLTDGSDGLINFIPPTWHETVLYNGLVWIGMKDSANIQSKSEQKAIYMEHLAAMRREERGGRQAEHQLIPFNPTRRVRRART